MLVQWRHSVAGDCWDAMSFEVPRDEHDVLMTYRAVGKE